MLVYSGGNVPCLAHCTYLLLTCDISYSTKRRCEDIG